ncbi:hypothetical protein BAPA111461_09685 [Bacillus paramycoides]
MLMLSFSYGKISLVSLMYFRLTENTEKLNIIL